MTHTVTQLSANESVGTAILSFTANGKQHLVIADGTYHWTLDGAEFPLMILDLTEK